MKKLFSQLGFTLIELLVVISVIGVLAVAVLSSINPIEQINKGRDTRTRSDAAQLINASDRFFATQEKYPWNDDTSACGVPVPVGGCDLATPGLDDPAVAFPSAGSPVCQPNAAANNIGLGLCKLDAAGGAWMDGLVATAEVKEAFPQRIKAQDTYAIYVFKENGLNEAMYACFRPSSLDQQKKAVAACKDPNITGLYEATTLLPAACPGDNPGTVNYTESGNKDELICLP